MRQGQRAGRAYLMASDTIHSHCQEPAGDAWATHLADGGRTVPAVPSVDPPKTASSYIKRHHAF